MSVSLDVNASHPSSECRKEKQMDKCSASLQQHCNVLQAFMSFLANDNLESCHMAFDNDDSEEEEEEKVGGMSRRRALKIYKYNRKAFPS